MANDDKLTTVSRRHVLGLISGATIGGIAGCGGDGDGTATETPTDTDDGSTPTATDTAMDTDTATPTDTDTATPTDTDTATPTESFTLPDPPDPLISIDGSPFQPIYPGESVTISTSFVNPYLEDLQNGEVVLEGSDGGFEISGASGTTFDMLESQDDQAVEWTVTVPDASGEYELTATVTYSAAGGGDEAEATLSVPVNVSGIEERDDEIFIPQTGGGPADEPAFTLLPEGDTVSDGANIDDAEDCSADFYFGYDADNLYLRAEVTDDTHAAKSGVDMWQNDNVQYAAGIDGTYGPEDGIAHVDGEAERWRWIEGEQNQGIDTVEMTTSRDDGNNLTTYEAAIPWEALFSESKGPGDAFNFSVQVNEADEVGSNRAGVLGWTLPGVNVDKTYGALGRFHLEEN